MSTRNGVSDSRSGLGGLQINISQILSQVDTNS